MHPTEAGFLTGLLVVIAPITGALLFRDRLTRAGWLAVAVATAGIGILSARATGFGPGEALTLAAATVWGLHLVLLARWAMPEQAMGVARIQTATVTGLALLTVAARSAGTDSSPLPQLPADGPAWLSVVLLAVLATAAAMLLLSWGQSRMTATRAAVILTLEPAAAGLTAAIMGGELGLRTVVGGALLVCAMVIVELGDRARPARPESAEAVAVSREC